MKRRLNWISSFPHHQKAVYISLIGSVDLWERNVVFPEKKKKKTLQGSGALEQRPMKEQLLSGGTIGGFSFYAPLKFPYGSYIN